MSMTPEYRADREELIKEHGLQTQLHGEAHLDRQEAEPFVERWDARSGLKARFRRNIANILDRKKETETMKSFSSPSLAYQANYDRIDWSQPL